VQLQEEAAGVAQHRTGLITSPQRRRARRAVLADRLARVSHARAEADSPTLVLMLSIGIRDKDKNMYISIHVHRRRSITKDYVDSPVNWPVRQASRAQRLRRSCCRGHCGPGRVCWRTLLAGGRKSSRLRANAKTLIRPRGHGLRRAAEASRAAGYSLKLARPGELQLP
jgi:hypothetical protein